MEVSLQDLDWCLDQCVPVGPSHLMALPTKNDPMLGYLTTSFQDHLRLRSKFGLKINEPMEAFFKKIGILDEKGNFTDHVGDPVWVYYQYKLAQGDTRSESEIREEGNKGMTNVIARGVPISVGYDGKPQNMNSKLKTQIESDYEDAKKCLVSELSQEFINTIPRSFVVKSLSPNRDTYIHQPTTGEQLSKEGVAAMAELQQGWNSDPDVQIVVSDGLNANAIMDQGHLLPYLNKLTELLAVEKMSVSEKIIVVINGRVRIGYQIGHYLFNKSTPDHHKTIIHVIGERPGTVHHNFSVYLASPSSKVWIENKMDHNLAKVISGISDTAYLPEVAAAQTIELLKELNLIN